MPAASVERIEFTAALERRSDGSETVPEAMILAAIMLPEKRPLPSTESACEGDVVPMPTLPPLVAKYAEPEEVTTVVEAYGKIEAADDVATKYGATGAVKATRFVVVAFVVVAFVAVRADVETLWAMRLPTLAKVEANVSMMPVVRCPMDEKNEVVVAEVPVARAKVKFWSVLEPFARMFPKVPCPVTEAFAENIVPVAVRLARERLPEMRPFPWTERFVEGVVVPTPTLPLVLKYRTFVPPVVPVLK